MVLSVGSADMTVPEVEAVAGLCTLLYARLACTVYVMGGVDAGALGAVKSRVTLQAAGLSASDATQLLTSFLLSTPVD